jgi:signal transduction histidine kinase
VRRRLKLNADYGQYRWVVSLLAVAVVLPTVCLLWFMNEAIDNERFVIRQKLVLLHNDQLEKARRKADEEWARRCRRLEDDEAHPYRLLAEIVAQGDCDALLMCDPSGRRLYPVSSSEADRASNSSAVLADAWQLEFVDRDYAGAAALYEQHALSASGYRRRLAEWVGKNPPLDDRGLLDALIGQSRCLAKLDRIGEALAVCRQVAFSALADGTDTGILSRIANARLLMLTWMQDRAQYDDLFEETFSKLLEMLYQPNQAGVSLPADQNLFLARKAMDLASQSPRLRSRRLLIHGTPLEKMVEFEERSLGRLAGFEERSLALAERFGTMADFETWKPDQLHPMKMGDEISYGLLHKSGRAVSLALLSDHTVRAALNEFIGVFPNDYVECRILDEAGRLVMGPAEFPAEPFAVGPVGAYFPNWKIELFFKEGDVLDRAAGQRIAVYTWTGTLVILLILICGAVAARSIGKQVKLNRLKNDFIATVTHELKTPLASMRVLVDTLLEGHYRDQQQVTDYLQLISKENGRLSRLIDNFLTFSRMERNKQAFQIRRASPAVIAHNAAEAVRTKFDRPNCHFETEVSEGLPDVMADPDAMVTVLVNLLDNAYKYSRDDKHITLRVASENQSVRFAVSDNGVGIPRRALGRIFKRFYQVDRTLSRRAEGCGLGLSIAKFIVDAHAGTIRVESRPGHGSTFTVTLPAKN